MEMNNEQIQDLNAEIHKILKKIEQQGTPINQETIFLAEECIKKVITEGKTPQEALQLTPVMVEKIYTYAYNLFQAGKYKEALPLFKALYQLDPFDARYSFAIAGCYHYSKAYLKAAGRYMVCCNLDPLNPVPFFHLYDCFMQTNHTLTAYHTLLMVLKLCDDHHQYANLKEKASLEMTFLENYLKPYIEENIEKSATTDVAN